MKYAYHFTNGKLRNGDPVPKIGEWLEHTGYIKICKSGLHASWHPFDALRYTPGNHLHLVEVEGIVESHDDKFVCRRRKIVKTIDAEALMREFARKCALDVIHLWDAPDVVIKYLKTGDKSLMAAAADAAAGSAAASWAAARAADAAWAAARAADAAASWAAARAASWARAAAWEAAWEAAAAADAARAKQKSRFKRMATKAFKEAK